MTNMAEGEVLGPTGNRGITSVTFGAEVTGSLASHNQLVDSFWIGNLLGAQALGAVAISSVIATTVLSFVIGMNNAALAILSQQRGRRDDAGLKRYLNAFIVILFTGSLLLGAGGFLAADTLPIGRAHV